MSVEFLSKYKWPIAGFTVIIALIMIVLATRSPQPFLSGFMGVLGTVLGASISQFAQWSISRREAIDTFRLAAVDRRLEAHQRAYSLWHELLWSASGNDEKKRSEDIQETGSIEGAVHIPLEEFIARKIEWPVDKSAKIVSYSSVGYRAIIAMTILWSYGYNDVWSLIG